MPFFALNELPKLELFPGIRSALVAGERVMLSALEMDDGGVVPEHSHPHEQAGLVLEGRLRLRIGGEERDLEPGDAFLIPSNVVHSGVVTAGPARVLDIFSPVREDYVNRYNSFTGTGGDTRWHDPSEGRTRTVRVDVPGTGTP